MKHLTTIIIFSISFAPLFSQQELGLHFMRDLWQSYKTNPALASGHNLTLGLPAFYQSVLLPASYNDLITEVSDEERIIDGDLLIASSDPENELFIDWEIETVSLGFPLLGFDWTIGHSLRFNRYWMYSRQGLELALEGNAQFIGEEVDFGPVMDVYTYSEFSLGLSRRFGAVTVGIRGKYLRGIGSVYSERTKASLFTDDDIFQITVNTDYQLHTASRLQPDSIEAISFSIDDFSFEDLFENNQGFAFDAGIFIRVNEKLDIALSAIDIGTINWTNNITSYSTQGTFLFEGIDTDDILNVDSFTVSAALDTLQEILEVRETSGNYSSNLPSKFYLSATYQLNEKWRLGGMAFLERRNGENYPAMAINAQFRAFEWLSAGATYSWRNDRFDNLGLQLILRAGPVQVYGTTDTFLAATGPYSNKHWNGRVGVNLVF